MRERRFTLVEGRVSGTVENFIQQLEKKKELFKKVEKELLSPELLQDRQRYEQKAKEYAELKRIVAEYDKFCSLDQEKKSLEKLIQEESENSEYAQMAKEELKEISSAIDKKLKKLEGMFLDGENPDHGRNVIMEVRAGTGGLEATLFASDLFRMYTKYAESKNWRIQVLSSSFSDAGGIKEIVLSIEGEDVFKFLRFEKGTHRVQRVPETETGGRIHTSAATVAVLPESEELKEVEIKNQDLKIDVYRSSGAGGQHVNVTDSAVRITHLPTGVVVSCQDERSQHKNKAKALRVLRARIYDKLSSQRERERSSLRKEQVGSGDRSEKIRTYNFPENRVTDHRIGLTIHNLANIIEGDLDPVIGPLLDEDRKLRLTATSRRT